jgi:serine protease Do
VASRAWSGLLVAALVVVPACKTKIGTGSGGAGTAAPLPSGAVPVGSGNLAPVTLNPVPKPEVKLDPGGPGGAPKSFAPIAKMADPSVVTINTVVEETDTDGFGRLRRRVGKGLGTGFVIDKDGIILTNNHVIDEAKAIVVTTSDDREFNGTVVGRDARTDVAVVRIDTKEVKSGPPLVPLALGDSDKLDVGDWVVAIGNPFGLSHTVSAGIVSAKGRGTQEVELDPSGYYNFIQTDASINPGNSGGPLLSLEGEVVGINTAIRGGGAQGIGFAIPVNMVKQLLPMLLRDGHISRSALGINVADFRELRPDARAELNHKDDKGAVVTGVVPGGPASRVGLAAKDIILEFDGQPVERRSQLQWLASMGGVGKTVPLRVSRDGKVFDIKVTLGELADAPPPAGRRPHGHPGGAP